MARRLAQVARLAWWTLSLPSLLSLGRLGREVAYISYLSKQSPHVLCWQIVLKNSAVEAQTSASERSADIA
jgi:hypothetical protein